MIFASLASDERIKQIKISYGRSREHDFHVKESKAYGCCAVFFSSKEEEKKQIAMK